MSKEDENKKTKLDILFDEQNSLLQRSKVFQWNLNTLLFQKAQYGIDVPLHILNNIKNQENEINDINKQVAKTQSEIDSLTSQDNKLVSDLQEVGAHVTYDGIIYKVETPFPFLRSETTQSADNALYTKIYFGGGFEMHSITEFNVGLSFSFYVHGQQVAPILDNENKKLIIPRGYGIVVPKVFANFLKMTREKDISMPPSQWTIISPAQPKAIVMLNEWPQGWNNAYITTTKISYEGGYEVWIAQSTKEDSVPTLWFYEQGWNVAPIINKQLLSLRFPKRTYNKGKDK